MIGLPVALLLALVAAALAAATYFVGPAAARPPRAAVLGRATAWGSLLLLVLDPGCAAHGESERPLVLLDTSLSLSALGGRLADARALADSLGEVRPFGGSRLLGPLTAAAAGNRPVIVVTDGEIRDAAALAAPLLEPVAVRVLPRDPQPDLIISRVSGPHHLLATDTATIRVTVQGTGARDWGSPLLQTRAGGRVVASRPVAIGVAGHSSIELRVPGAALGPGQHLLEIGFDSNQTGDLRTSIRLHSVEVARLPGIVVTAAAPGWESRFLYRTIASISDVPTRGFLQVTPGDWRRMDDSRPVSLAQVSAAVREANLVVGVGGDPPGVETSRAGGRWDWPAVQPTAGDWYLSAVPGAPGSAGLSAVPVESLPPAVALATVVAPDAGWTGFTAQLGRRGTERAAVVGGVVGRQRHVTVGASGLWRWAFRGGLAEQAYRAWVAEIVHWLLAADVSETAPIRLSRAVVAQDEPLVVEWHGLTPPATVEVRWEGEALSGGDTLTFDGAGRAAFSLPTGAYQVFLGDHPPVRAAVEEYSSELLPGPVVLGTRDGAAGSRTSRRGARDGPWLFALLLIAWCLEWWARRRAGLR